MISEELWVSFWMLGSTSSSILIIFINKFLMQTLDFDLIFLITSCHFACAWLFSNSLVCLGYMEVKVLSIREKWTCGFTGTAAIGFSNLSLQKNTVTIYQLSKLLIIPIVIFFERASGKHRQLSRPVVASILCMSLGVLLSTTFEVSITVNGLIYALLAAIYSAYFQVQTERLQNVNGLNPFQVLHMIALPQLAVMSVLVLIFEVFFTRKIFASVWSHEQVTFLFLSCAISIVVNVTSFGVIGKTSPITYQVVGQAKTALILLGGYLLFDSKFGTPEDHRHVLSGTIICLLGSFGYSTSKLLESEVPPRDAKLMQSDVIPASANLRAYLRLNRCRNTINCSILAIFFALNSHKFRFRLNPEVQNIRDRPHNCMGGKYDNRKLILNSDRRFLKAEQVDLDYKAVITFMAMASCSQQLRIYVNEIIDNLRRVELFWNRHKHYNIIIYHNGVLSEEMKHQMAKESPSLIFNHVLIYLPDRVRDNPEWLLPSKIERCGSFGTWYKHMGTLFSYQIFTDGSLDEYDYFLRFDSDYYLTKNLPIDLFEELHMKRKDFAYTLRKDVPICTEGFYEHSEKYMTANNLKPLNYSFYSSITLFSRSSLNGVGINCVLGFLIKDVPGGQDVQTWEETYS